jgi:OOP family OmpA-OmpF porin
MPMILHLKFNLKLISKDHYMQRYFYLLLMLFASGVFAQTGPADNAIVKQILFIDSDGDGVDDTVDQCYKTPPNTKVNEKGCFILIKDLKTIRVNINFAIDSSVIETEFFSEVKKVASFLNDNPLTRAVIEGHTDNDGSEEYNRSLSQRRAQAIAQLLVREYEIDPIRLTAVGFGESKPLVPNNSVSNMARNRRSVAVIRALQEKHL